MGHSAHCLSAAAVTGGTTREREKGAVVWAHRATGALRGVGAGLGSAAARQSDVLSLLALRERTIRLWLAALGMLGFGVAYVSPIGLALTTPSVAPKVVL